MNMEGSKSNKEFIGKLYLKFFFPAILSYLSLSLATIIDDMYVGRVSGERGLFVIGAGFPVYCFFYMVSLGISQGASILFTRRLSEGNKKEAKSYFLSALTVLLVAVILFAVIGMIFLKPLVSFLGVAPEAPNFDEVSEYCRIMLMLSPVIFTSTLFQLFVHSDGRPLFSAIAVFVGTVVDVASGYIFIVVWGMGANGAVFSLAAGSLANIVILLTHFLRKDSVATFHLKQDEKLLQLIIPRKGAESFGVGFATGTQYIYEFIITLAFNRMLIWTAGDDAVAIYEIVINVGELVVSVITAAVVGLLPITSVYYGERNRDGVMSTFRFAVITSLSFTVIGALIVEIFAPGICSVMGLSKAVRGEGTLALRLYALSLIPLAFNMIVSIFLETVEKEKYAYIITALSGLLILLPAGEILGFVSLEVFWTCFLIAELAVTVIILVFYFVMMKRMGMADLLKFDSSKVFSETFEGECETVSTVIERLQDFLDGLGASPKKGMMITVAVDEICRLIAESDGKNILKLQLTLLAENGMYVLHIRDNNATSFNPFDIPEDDERALGLKIVKNQALRVDYTQFGGFNTLTIEFDAAEKEKRQ